MIPQEPGCQREPIILAANIQVIRQSQGVKAVISSYRYVSECWPSGGFCFLLLCHG